MNRNIHISDITLKRGSIDGSAELSFKEKIELARLLDSLGVSVIEIEGIKGHRKTDSLRIKTIAAAVKNAELAVPVDILDEGPEEVWKCLKEAKAPRLQVMIPVSTVQMEYLYHMKPEKMAEAAFLMIEKCRALTGNVEFIANDAARSDKSFLHSILAGAVKAGASTVTVCDPSGTMLPTEFAAFIKEIKALPELDGVKLGAACSSRLFMADTCGAAAVKEGADEIKCSAYPRDDISLPNIARILEQRGESLGAECGIRGSQLYSITEQIRRLFNTRAESRSPFERSFSAGEEDSLSSKDDKETVIRFAEKMGYSLSDEDRRSVWESFSKIAEKKEKIGARELDAIIASAALQVPMTYKIESYMISCGNLITSMAHIKISRDKEMLEGMAVGDGPIDAAFMALEGCIGHHYELDDFQIKAVTEGREAMGETIVKLRSNGKLYSGRGISTDIVGASISAYVSALNKISYEEEEE